MLYYSCFFFFFNMFLEWPECVERLWELTTVPCMFFPASSDFKNTLYVVLNYIFKRTVCVCVCSRGIMQHVILSTK